MNPRIILRHSVTQQMEVAFQEYVSCVVVCFDESHDDREENQLYDAPDLRYVMKLIYRFQ